MTTVFAPFTEDHFRFQVEATRIDRLLENGDRRHEGDRQVARVVDIMHRTALPHLRAEGDVLVPLLEGHPDAEGPGLAGRVVEAQAAVLNAVVAVREFFESRQDHCAALRGLGHALRRHVALVEDEVVPWVVAHVDEGSLERIGKRVRTVIAEGRRPRGGPGATK